MTQSEPALQSLRRKLDQTEEELRRMGYQVDRCVNPPGAMIGNQRFEGEILILVLYGHLHSRSSETVVELNEGDRLHVPSGVPYTLRVDGETSAYWLQAFRPDPTGEDRPPS